MFINLKIFFIYFFIFIKRIVVNEKDGECYWLLYLFDIIYEK